MNIDLVPQVVRRDRRAALRREILIFILILRLILFLLVVSLFISVIGTRSG